MDYKHKCWLPANQSVFLAVINVDIEEEESVNIEISVDYPFFPQCRTVKRARRCPRCWTGDVSDEIMLLRKANMQGVQDFPVAKVTSQDARLPT